MVDTTERGSLAVPSMTRTASTSLLTNDPLRRLSRSPHPYKRQHSDLIQSNEQIPQRSGRSSLRRALHEADDDESDQVLSQARPLAQTSSTTTSDSGTDADDEHYLKGLPAPRLRPHKGLRGGDTPVQSQTPSPMLSPMILEGDAKRLIAPLRRPAVPSRLGTEESLRIPAGKLKRMRRIELLRRALEVLILGVVGSLLFSHEAARRTLWEWKRELITQLGVVAYLFVLYPIRLIRFLSKRGKPASSITIPIAFDPAPLLYPAVLPIFVAVTLSSLNPTALLPNLILSIAALPSQLIPFQAVGGENVFHWLLSCLPLFASGACSASKEIGAGILKSESTGVNIECEILSSLHPLHQALSVSLHYLATTSLLPAELQLLSIALISLLLLAQSPQAKILTALLWIGGVGISVTCGHVLKWGVALARVPKWRFRRTGSSNGKHRGVLRVLYTWLTFVLGKASCESDDELRLRRQSSLKLDLPSVDDHFESNAEVPSYSAIEPKYGDTFPLVEGLSVFELNPLSSSQRRHTLPNISSAPRRSGKTTPSGRKKRAASSSIRYFFALTPAQAAVRKWLYAGYVYSWVAVLILLGIRSYVGERALNGNEPVGWALGYMFGGLPWFRMEVVKKNLERWICLPPRTSDEHSETCQLGWVEHVRHTTFGPANTRLLLLGYWACILVTGLLVVFRLSAIYEVDTRRKVFHFMMVAILLPSTYIDPTFAALSLSIILAIFLLLDLFRATQLPPLSQPLAAFLAPYVDGRDLRGPVVISHIFLLIGCAIPLWLSLGAVSRTGSGFAAGWEVTSRDVSMVSGVICVGMGDAAASLVGRRFGRRKWIWPGGKSIEGSVAFAGAVAIALLIAKAWLKIGGWQETLGHGGYAGGDSWSIIVGKAVFAATIASLTEAVLTGGNDNVVVPVVLWLCVKGLGL